MRWQCERTFFFFAKVIFTEGRENFLLAILRGFFFEQERAKMILIDHFLCEVDAAGTFFLCQEAQKSFPYIYKSSSRNLPQGCQFHNLFVVETVGRILLKAPGNPVPGKSIDFLSRVFCGQFQASSTRLHSRLRRKLMVILEQRRPGNPDKATRTKTAWLRGWDKKVWKERKRKCSCKDYYISVLIFCLQCLPTISHNKTYHYS